MLDKSQNKCSYQQQCRNLDGIHCKLCPFHPNSQHKIHGIWDKSSSHYRHSSSYCKHISCFLSAFSQHLRRRKDSCSLYSRCKQHRNSDKLHSLYLYPDYSDDTDMDKMGRWNQHNLLLYSSIFFEKRRKSDKQLHFHKSNMLINTFHTFPDLSCCHSSKSCRHKDLMHGDTIFYCLRHMTNMIYHFHKSGKCTDKENTVQKLRHKICQCNHKSYL